MSSTLHRKIFVIRKVPLSNLNSSSRFAIPSPPLSLCQESCLAALAWFLIVAYWSKHITLHFFPLWFHILLGIMHHSLWYPSLKKFVICQERLSFVSLFRYTWSFLFCQDSVFIFWSVGWNSSQQPSKKQTYLQRGPRRPFVLFMSLCLPYNIGLGNKFVNSLEEFLTFSSIKQIISINLCVCSFFGGFFSVFFKHFTMESLK